MKILKIIGLVLVVLFAAIFIYAKVEGIAPIGMVDKNEINTTDGLAIQGYDPVNYFIERTALKGSEQYQLEWNGATWRFVSEANKITFENDPESYAPQFSGHCAFAVSTGFTANCNPEIFFIHENKLYLFHADDVRKEALQQGESFFPQAQKQWQE